MAEQTPSFHDLIARLSEKRALFVREYLIDLNATQAAIRAGYSAHSAHAQGHRLLKDAEVQAAIEAGYQRTSERLDITAERIQQEMAKLAFSNMADFVKINGDGEPYIDLSQATRDQMAALSETSIEDFMDGRGDDAREVRRVKIKTYDKRGALMDLAKLAGLHTDTTKHDVTDAFAEFLQTLSSRGSKAPIQTKKEQG